MQASRAGPFQAWPRGTVVAVAVTAIELQSRTPVRDEDAAQSVRHGAVWVSYRPDLPPAQLRELDALTTFDPYDLVAPRSGLPSTIVVSEAKTDGLSVKVSSSP